MQKFDRTHHKALWEYMAQEKTINDIINETIHKLDEPYTPCMSFGELYYVIVDSVYDKKKEFIVQHRRLYDDIPINCCYACKTSCGEDIIHNCYGCPIDLKGFCEEDNSKFVTKGNLYDRYTKYIAHIVMNPKNKDKYIKQAQKMALQIANAKLQYEVEEI